MVVNWWGRGDSNSYALRHMILNHARLPVPTLPRSSACDPPGTRTRNTLIKSQLLCQIELAGPGCNSIATHTRWQVRGFCPA